MGGCKKSNSGNVLAIMNLYDLDEDKRNEEGQALEIKASKQNSVREPKNYYKLRFNLDKAFVNTKFTLDDLIWQCMTSSVQFTKDSKVIEGNTLQGSVLYEDFDTNELKLNFYTAEIDKVRTSPPHKLYESA